MSSQCAFVGKHFRSEQAEIIMDPASIAEVFSMDYNRAIRKLKIPKDSSFNTLFKGGFSLSHRWVQGHVCPALGQPDLRHCLPQVREVLYHSFGLNLILPPLILTIRRFG